MKIKRLQSPLGLGMMAGLAVTAAFPVQANPIPSINGVSLNIPQIPSGTVPLPGTNFSNGSTANATNNNSVVQRNSGGNAYNHNSVVQTTSVTASGNNTQTTASNQATTFNGSVSSTSSATSSVSGVQSNSSATATLPTGVPGSTSSTAYSPTATSGSANATVTSYPTGVSTTSTTAVMPAVTVFVPNSVTTTATTNASAATYISAFAVPTSLQVSSNVAQNSTKIRVQNADNSTNGQGSYVVVGVPSRVFPGLGLTLVQSHR